jgi:peroxiredoxin (alkyl hydroperoxide reductase subunit C)
MHENSKHDRGPLLGEAAPYFETVIGRNTITSKDFKGNWLIVVSHPDDVLPLFKTRTIHYVLCKRKTKVIALGNRKSPRVTPVNFVKNYILKHTLTMIDDSDKIIAARFGLDGNIDGEDAKGIFVIDPKGILRMKLYATPAAERNFYEILKLIDALQNSDNRKTKKTLGRNAEAMS